MKYFTKYEGFKHADELLGGTYEDVELRNVEVGSTAAITRGTILASATPNGTYAAATTSDVNKNLVIAAADFEGSSDLTVTQAYASGVFNREKIIAPNSDTSIFELELRRQNIRLTSILPNYD